ncbi:MAG: nuclease-related domain-containing protein [Janthinobacterium lividum]
MLVLIMVIIGLAVLGYWLIGRMQPPAPRPPLDLPARPSVPIIPNPIAALSDDEPPAGSATRDVLDGRETEAVLRGQAGENRVNDVLRRFGRPFLMNLYLEDDRGLTQVDHVVRMPWGIVVIETKTYGGFISGTRNPTRWKQSFQQYGSGTYYLFQNPEHQNDRHLHAVRQVTGLAEHVVSLVVFAGTARTSRRVHERIVRLDRLLGWLIERARAGSSSRPAVNFISDQRLDTAWSRLELHALGNTHRAAEHLAALQTRH